MKVDDVVLQDYTELLEENHYFYKEPFSTSDVINKAEIRIGGDFKTDIAVFSF